MNFPKVLRYAFILLLLSAAACRTPESVQNSTGSDDNGANCGGTPLNKENCINNQNRMP